MATGLWPPRAPCCSASGSHSLRTGCVGDQLLLSPAHEEDSSDESAINPAVCGNRALDAASYMNNFQLIKLWTGHVSILKCMAKL